MKLSHVVLLLVLFVPAPRARAQGHPIPPGVRQADQTEEQTQKNIPPPNNPRVTVDYAKLKQAADELAVLAQSIPPAVGQATQGVLPKDLADKLKRIEKLAKQLRNQLNR